MNLDDLKAFVQANAYIIELWINADGIAYLQNPQKDGFENVSREDLLKEIPTEDKPLKGKK